MRQAPQKSYYAGSMSMTLMGRDEIDLDPRGVIWMWEPPNPGATYVMGIDPTVGLTGWDRLLRVSDDKRTDNGAIEIIQVGSYGRPDRQVCEYAAPIDPEDLAGVANMLGRLYGGSNEDGQCLAIIEVYPGPGLLTMRKMINDYGYLNHFVWKYQDSIVPKATGTYGWHATGKSVRDLWIRGSRHILKGNLAIASPWLVEEMTDAEMDTDKMTAKANYGAHDDRLRAILMAVWAAHEWSIDIETEKVQISETENMPDYQATDVSSEFMNDDWNEKWGDLGT